MKNEKGLSIVETILYIVIISIVSICISQLISLVAEHYSNVRVYDFYDELSTIDKYIKSYTENDYSYSYSPKELTIQNKDGKMELSSTKDGVVLILTDSNSNPVNINMKYIKDFQITSVDKVIGIGNNGEQDSRYEIPIEGTFQIYYNPTPPKQKKAKWLTEVIIYAL